MATITEDQRKSVSGRLLTTAWGIEYIAASIGLIIGITRIIIALQTSPDESSTLKLWTNAALAGLPFFAVAMVELTKIPFLTAFYYTKDFVYRMIFLAGVAILMAITFETFFVGFESSFSLTSKELQIKRTAVMKTIAEIKQNKDVSEDVGMSGDESIEDL